MRSPSPLRVPWDDHPPVARLPGMNEIGDRVDELIRRNHALLRRVEATRAYTFLLFDEAGEAILEAHVKQLRARHLLRFRLAALHKRFSGDRPIRSEQRRSNQ